MVEIVDSDARLRIESYEHINEILQPNFYLQSAGTGTLIYQGHCPNVIKTENVERFPLISQWHNVRSISVGCLFLCWDNVRIIITGQPDMFYDVGVELEKHGYRVQIEV